VKVALGIFAVVSWVAGILVIIAAATTTGLFQEIEGTLLILNGTVCFGAAAVISAIRNRETPASNPIANRPQK
jgi:hypothetical protein